METSRSARASALALALISAALSACGGGGEESEQDRVADAVTQLQDDMRAGRIRAICAALTDTAQRQVGSVGHGRKPTNCEDDMREFVVGTELNSGSDFTGLRKAKRPDVVEVELAADGRTAVAVLASGGDPFRLPLAKTGDRWKLADFFGAAAPAPKDLR